MLKTSCHVKSETMSINLSHFFILKSTIATSTLNASFLHLWFGYSIYCSLGKYHSLSYADFLTVHTFHYTIFKKKNTFAKITIDRIRSSKVGNTLKLTAADAEVFQNFNLTLTAQIFSLATNTVNCFSWSVKLTLFFSKNYLPNVCQLKYEKSSISLPVVLSK